MPSGFAPRMKRIGNAASVRRQRLSWVGDQRQTVPIFQKRPLPRNIMRHQIADSGTSKKGSMMISESHYWKRPLLRAERPCMERQSPKRYLIVEAMPDGGVQVHEMKKWCRLHPEQTPPGMSAAAGAGRRRQFAAAAPGLRENGEERGRNADGGAHPAPGRSWSGRRTSRAI
jgi:hypothetical protein